MVHDNLVLNIPDVFESILIEIQSKKHNAIIGEIYRLSNINEVKYINR